MTDAILKRPPEAVGSVRIGAPRPAAPQRQAPSQPAAARVVPVVAPAPPAPTPEQTQALARELEALRAAARKAGYEEGEAAALQEAATLERALKAQLAAALTSLTDALQRHHNDQAQACFDIAFAATVKVFGRRSVHAEAIEGVVQEALAQAGRSAAMQVHLHPADAQLVEHLLQGAAAPAWPEAMGACYPDPSVRAGGCIIRTAQGDVDARLETQLAGLAELLIQHREAARGEAQGEAHEI